MPPMETYQILVPIVALAFWAYTIFQFIKGRSSIVELLFWSLFWLLTIALALFPDSITDRLARWLGMKSNINALVFLALGILFFLQFRLYFLVKRQNSIISELVRKLALKEDEKDEA